MNREPPVRDRGLRAELRRGDPGAAAVLAPAEEEAMRRATLDAAADSGRRRAARRPRPRPARWAATRARHLGRPGRSALQLLAAAAAAAVCVVAALSWQERLWQRRAGEAEPRPLPRHAMAARRPQPSALGSAAGDGTGRASRAAAGPVSSTTAQVLRGAKLDGRAPRRRETVLPPPATTARAPVAVGDERGAPVDLAVAVTSAAVAAPPRQVQFSLPGGTRVIWLVRGPASR